MTNVFSHEQIHKTLDFYVIDISGPYCYILSCHKEWGDFRVNGYTKVRFPKRSADQGVFGDLRTVLLALERGLQQIQQQLDGVSSPEHVLFTIHAQEIFADHLGMTYVRENADAPVTLDELDEMMLQIEKRALERSEEHMKSYWWALPTHLKLAATVLTYISLDDTNLANPIGFSGRLLRLNLLNVFCGSKYFSILSTIARHLWLQVIAHLPIGLAFSKLEQYMDYSEDELLVLLDIGYAHTHITMMRQTKIEATTSCEIGTKDIELFVKKHHKKIDSLTLERILRENDTCIADADLRALVWESHGFLRDMVTGVITKMIHEMTYKPLSIRLISLSGLLPPSFFERLLAEIGSQVWVETELVFDISILRQTLSACDDAEFGPEYHGALSGAIAACDILDFRDDPMTSTLKKVIYQYA